MSTCVVCSGPTKRQGDKTCGPECRKVTRRLQSRKDKASARARAAESGLCRACQQDTAEPGFTCCAPCRERSRSYCARKRAEAIQKKLCNLCRTRPRANPYRSRSGVHHGRCAECQRKSRDPTRLLRHLCLTTRKRAREKGWAWNLDIPALVARVHAGHCEATGLSFEWGTGSPWAPSIDRIDSARGYTMDNVQVVCWIYNQAKNTYTDAELLRLARAIASRASAEGAA